MNIIYDMYSAYDANVHEHPQQVMSNLGIRYFDATPQSVADCWIFWNCRNLPNELPVYLSALDKGPMEFIGSGLLKESAISILKDSRRSA